MMCPFCGKEMAEGFVKGLPDRSLLNGRLYWDTKAKMKVSELFLPLKFQALAVSHYDACYPAVKSYKCDTCKKIIMDTYIEEEV